jgi:alanyl-tRNA synthetase
LSVEFCGGTHLSRTGETGAFALIAETGVAKGIRRVEGLTGVAAQAALATAAALEARLAEAERLPDSEVPAAQAEIGAALDQMTLSIVDKARLRRRLAGLQERAKAAAKASAGLARDRAIGEARQLAAAAQADLRPVIVGQVDAGEDRAALQAAARLISDALPSAAVLLASVSAERVSLHAEVPESVVKRGLKAGDWVKAAAEACGGKGGGKPTQAQGGGTEPGRVGEALRAASQFAARVL